MLRILSYIKTFSIFLCWFIIFAFLIGLLLNVFTTSKDHFYNVTKFETVKAGGAGDFWTSCIGKGKVIPIWDYGEFLHTDTAKIISDDVSLMNIEVSSGIIFGSVLAANIARFAIYKSLLASGMWAVVAIAALGVEYSIMSEACSRLYIVAPHDEINRNNGAQCVFGSDGNVEWVPGNDSSSKGAVSAAEVPYFYHCDCQKEKPDDPVASQWGCRGFAGDFACAGGFRDNALPGNVGKIIVEYYPKFAGTSSLCAKDDKRRQITISPGEISYLNSEYMIYPIYAYYKNTNGGTQLCAMTPYTLLPILIGCTPVPPPLEPKYFDAKKLPKANRCAYLIEGGRPDLSSLADSLNNADNIERSSEPIKKFLAGDFHITSTLIGCIQDMFYQTLINPKQGGSDQASLYATVQERMRDIVMAVLTLYISLVAINIMSSPQEPKAAELIMHLIKLSLVIFFTLGDGWYQEVTNNQNTGLFKTILHAPDELANMFLQAQSQNDPANRCGYRYADGTELLSEREMPATTNATYGWGNNVRLSAWDLVDCKIMSYMNFGTCSFNFSEILSLIGFMFSKLGLMIAIFGFFYAFILLLLIFRLAFISAFMVAILSLLVFISPIVFCFSLFNYTKETFSSWLRNILSFMLFPAVLFGYLAFMFTVFDGILYGSTYYEAAYSYNQQTGVDLATICPASNNSLYCTVAQTAKADPCSKWGVFRSALNSSEIAENFSGALVKLLIFAFLFYMLLDVVMKFLPYILSIPGNISERVPDKLSPNLASFSRYGAGLTSKGAAYTAGVTARGVVNVVGAIRQKARF